MRRLGPKFALVATALILMLSHFPGWSVTAAGAPSQPAKIISGPELEMATDSIAIIRWTTTNPGGTALHYGIVRYGLDADNLTEAAKSPNRRNPSHPDMIFRVRVAGLKARTTYYYRVESIGATGVSDGEYSTVSTFRTK